MATRETHTKLAKHIMRLLKITEITFPIGRTPKGNLGITFNVNNDDFDLMLDSVPLSTKSELHDENNIELKRMVEKYYFEPEKEESCYNVEAFETFAEQNPEHQDSVTASAPKKKAVSKKK